MTAIDTLNKAGEALGSASGTLYGDMKGAIVAISEKAFDALTQLASLLGTTALHIYQIFVRQQIVVGISNLIGVTVWILGLFVGFKFTKFISDEDDKADWVITAGVIASVWSIAWFAGLFGVFTDSIKKISNPEYYAIQEISGLIKDTVKK